MAEVRESYVVKIDTPDPARIWSGVGNLELPADGIVESAPAIYLGAGELVSVPDFQQLINGIAERLEFVVSGVSDEVIRYALEESEDVRNAPIYIGRIDFDEDWQQLGPVEWEATFRADCLTVESDAGGGRRVRTIKLSVGTDDTGRTYAPATYFTDADQRLRSPDDDFFSFIAKINSGTHRIFGPRFEEQ